MLLALMLLPIAIAIAKMQQQWQWLLAIKDYGWNSILQPSLIIPIA